MTRKRCQKLQSVKLPPSHKATGDRYAETRVVLRQDLRHVIVSDELSLVKLSEYPFSERFLDSFEV
jgi:hypothetical protein